MPPLEPNQQAAGDIYVPRNETPENYLDWATHDKPPTRLRSVVGPPASGKTTFLRQLHMFLRRNGEGCLVLPLLQLGSIDDKGFDWLNNVSDSLRGSELPFAWRPSNPGGSFKDEWIAAVTALVRACSSYTKPVLLADGFDELDAVKRQWVEENVLIPFLFPTSTKRTCFNRAVLARRDQYALGEPVLHWEDEAHPLLGLEREHRAEQVRRRLAAVQGQSAAKARETLEWPDAPDAAIAFIVDLDPSAGMAMVGAISPFLTSNPGVNLLLLRRQLLHPVAPLDAADCRNGLEQYLERSRLPGLMVEELVDLVSALPNPASFTSVDYNNSPGKPQLQRLKDCGIVTQILGTARYCVEPAVIQLVHHIHPLVGQAHPHA